MSLIPFLLDDDDDWSFYRRPTSRYSPRYNVDNIIAPLTFGRYLRPWRTNSAVGDTGSTVTADKEKFQVSLDVQQFTPEEITVKAGDNFITIEGKHEEKKDEHGFISRHFVRRYMLPKGYDEAKLTSNLSSDGVLTITAPVAGQLENKQRAIPIAQTGKPAKPIEEKKK